MSESKLTTHSVMCCIVEIGTTMFLLHGFQTQCRHVFSKGELPCSVGQGTMTHRSGVQRELGDGMITDVPFEDIPIIQSRVSKPTMWRTNGERLQ